MGYFHEGNLEKVCATAPVFPRELLYFLVYFEYGLNWKHVMKIYRVAVREKIGNIGK